MLTTSYSAFRKDLKSYFQRVNADSEELLVTNTNPEDNVVVMSVRDYEAMQETMRIYRNPYLYEKVRRGIQEVKNNSTVSHALLEEDDL